MPMMKIIAWTREEFPKIKIMYSQDGEGDEWIFLN